MDEDTLRSKVSIGVDAVYVEVFPCGHPLGSELDANNLIALCMENHADRILVHKDVFSESFFRLRTGVAGVFLQKFTNYSIKAAILFDARGLHGSTVLEMMAEVNQGDQIRFFEDAEEAREWLTATSVFPL